MVQNELWNEVWITFRQGMHVPCASVQPESEREACHVRVQEAIEEYIDIQVKPSLWYQNNGPSMEDKIKLGAIFGFLGIGMKLADWYLQSRANKIDYSPFK